MPNTGKLDSTTKKYTLKKKTTRTKKYAAKKKTARPSSMGTGAAANTAKAIIRRRMMLQE